MPYDLCGSCSGQITDEFDIICRSGCQLHFHAKCVRIDKNLLNIINISPNIFWFCNSCSSVANLGILSKVKQLSEQVTTLSEELAKIQISLTNRNINNICESVPRSIDDSSLTSSKTATSHLNNRENRNVESENKTNFITSRSIQKSKKINKYKRNKNHNNNVIAGSLCAGSNIRAASTKVSMHIAKLHRDTTTNDVISHVTKTFSINSNDIQCYRLTKLDADIANLRSVSFLLIIPSQFQQNIRRVENWPYGVKIKRFQHKPKNDSSAATPTNN